MAAATFLPEWLPADATRIIDEFLPSLDDLLPDEVFDKHTGIMFVPEEGRWIGIKESVYDHPSEGSDGYLCILFGVLYDLEATDPLTNLEETDRYETPRGLAVPPNHFGVRWISIHPIYSTQIKYSDNVGGVIEEWGLASVVDLFRLWSPSRYLEMK